MAAALVEERHLQLAARMYQAAQTLEPAPGEVEDFQQIAKMLARMGCFR